MAQGADPKAEDQEGRSPLICAVIGGNSSLVRILAPLSELNERFERAGREAVEGIVNPAHRESSRAALGVAIRHKERRDLGKLLGASEELTPARKPRL